MLQNALREKYDRTREILSGAVAVEPTVTVTLLPVWLTFT